MRLGQSDNRFDSLRFAGFAALVAVVVTLTGFEAFAHGHPPAVDGWHHADCPEEKAGDEEFNSCSICRLAHETSSAPVTARTVSEPLPIVAPRIQDPLTLTAAAPAREHSPRAPPCLASC